MEARDLLADGDPEYSSNPCCLKTWDLEEDDSDFWDLNRSQTQPFIVDQKLWASYTRGVEKEKCHRIKCKSFKRNIFELLTFFANSQTESLKRIFVS